MVWSSAKLLPRLISQFSTSSVGYKGLSNSLRNVNFGALRSLATDAQATKKFNPIREYKQLSKFRLSSLVMFTASAGFVAGSEETIDWVKLMWTSLGTFGAAACANTMNQLYEVANDRLMTRTWNRPLPSGRLTRLHAALFALVCGATGVYILNDKANSLTAVLGVTNILLYAGIYTPMKQLTIWNTWVGAVVGAIPPLMGWAAASGELEAGAAVLAAALFFWQMPHFLSLAWLCKDDYLRGGFRMMPMVDPLGRRTAAAAVRHCVYIAPIGLLAYLAGVTTEPFAWEAAALSAVLGVRSMQFAANPSQNSARSLFKLSLLYLPLLMAGMVAHRLPNKHDCPLEIPAVVREALALSPLSDDNVQNTDSGEHYRRLASEDARDVSYNSFTLRVEQFLRRCLTLGCSLAEAVGLGDLSRGLAERAQELTPQVRIKCPSKALCEAEDPSLPGDAGAPGARDADGHCPCECDTCAEKDRE